MAILALIVTPLVLNIIRKARTAADKKSIDAYGRSIEIAIAGYLLDNGTFPTSIGQLTIEYSGDEVVCSATQLNGDSSVYLTGCTVGGRSVDYTYGTDKTPSTPTYEAYSVGDPVTYNNVNYYVIADSSSSESTVTLLKAVPLTVGEVNQYGEGHVNRYTNDSIGTAYNLNGYGGVAYYTSGTCGYINYNWVTDGCTTNYEQSEVKYIVDAWKNDQAPTASEARLIQYDELFDGIGYEKKEYCSAGDCYTQDSLENVPNWVYNSNYYFWTNTSYNDSSFNVWMITDSGMLSREYSVFDKYVVRPVIVLPKSELD